MVIHQFKNFPILYFFPPNNYPRLPANYSQFHYSILPTPLMTGIQIRDLVEVKTLTGDEAFPVDSPTGKTNRVALKQASDYVIAQHKNETNPHPEYALELTSRLNDLITQINTKQPLGDYVLQQALLDVIASLQKAIDTKQVSGNYATLSGGIIPTSLLPNDWLINTTSVGSDAEMVALISFQQGDFVWRSDKKAYYDLNDNDPKVLGNWQRRQSSSIRSINQQTGPDVVLSANDISAEPSGAVVTHSITNDHSTATPSAKGMLSASDKTKLDGVASGATANSPDTQLRDRATHTGTQNWSTITNTPKTLSGYGITDAATLVGGKIPTNQLPDDLIKMIDLAPITEPPLTAAGSTQARSVANYRLYSYQVQVSGIGTNVVLRMEATHLTNPTSINDWYSLQANNIDTTITANGSYKFQVTGETDLSVRMTLVSFVGGTPSVICTLIRGN
jgi:hypothetical protein